MTQGRALRDRYGFLFWLRWIVWFAGSFVLAALGWTKFLQYFFGAIKGSELTLTWVVAVFGSWFILVIPFMRKKEQIWKRLNTDQERAVDAWLLGVSVFIGSLVVSALAWAFMYRQRFGLSQGLDPLWARAVFGSWIVILIPFLILMYRKADAIFLSAQSRQTYEPSYRRQFMEESQRQLPAHFVTKLSSVKPILANGHLVDLKLKDGRQVRYVFVLNGREILGVYDRDKIDFTAGDVEAMELVSPENLPVFDPALWLRLDINL